MADEILSTPSAAGDPGNTGGQQEPGQSVQTPAEGQNAGPGSVGNQAVASSAGQQERSYQNFTRAQQRTMERTIKTLLDQSLQPLVERFNSFQIPPAPTQSVQSDAQIDLNDIPGSINRLVEIATNQRLGKFEKETLSDMGNKFGQELNVRETKTFLLSQPEINGDKNKMSEIRDIIEDDPILSIAFNLAPMDVSKEAFKRWKSVRVNPNAPQKATLTTIAGGAAKTGGIQMPSAEELQKLQKVITSNVPESEKQSAYKRIEELQQLAA